MVKVRFPHLGIVYSQSPEYEEKSKELRELLEKLEIIPIEEYELENFQPNDSPGAIGLYFDGAFLSFDFIFKQHPGELEKSLERERSERILMASGIQ